MKDKSAIPFEAIVAHERRADPQFSRLLARGIAVLRCFTPDDVSLGNAEIRRRTGLPAATVFRLTYTLNLLGYLKYLPETQEMALGSSVLSLGYPKLAKLQIRQTALPHMRRLAEQFHGSVNLGVPERLAIVFIESVRFDDQNRNRPDIGLAHPLLQTAIGRAYLAALPSPERTVIFNRLKLADARLFEQFRPSVDKAIASFEKRGFCTSFGEMDPAVLGVAAPIRGQPNKELFLLNCSVLSSQYDTHTVEKQIAPQLVKMVRRIEGEVRTLNA